MGNNAPLWLTLLEKAVAEANDDNGRGGKSKVAKRLGVSRPYVSRAMSGDLDPVPQKFIDRVVSRLQVVAECPATTLPQPLAECRRIAMHPAPTHNPLAMRIWKTCQSCPHKPEGDRK